MECPQCQWSNPSDKAFCFKCGAFLFEPQARFRLASIGRRVWATFLDGILFIITLIIGYLILFIIVARHGQTPGKQLAKDYCIEASGEAIHFWRMVWREFVSQYLLAFVTGSIFGWLDYLWALWDKDKQTLHDKMAGTWVVKPLHG